MSTREFQFPYKKCEYKAYIKYNLKTHKVSVHESIRKNKSLKNLYIQIVQPVSSLRTHQQHEQHDNF